MGIWHHVVPIYRVTPHCFAIHFKEIVSRFVLNLTFLIFGIFERSEIAKNKYFDVFWPKIGVWPPRVTIRGVTPWGGHNYFLRFQSYFQNNFGLGWFFMFKLTKMTKNRQNMVKMWKFKFSCNFGTPQGVDGKPKFFLKKNVRLSRCLLT